MAEAKTKKTTKTTSAKTAATTKPTKTIKTEKPVTKAAKPETAVEIDSTYGKDMSTAGFAISVASIFINFFTLGLLAIVGLVLSIIGRVQSSKTGNPNSLALAGIIISGIVIALSTLAFLLVVFAAIISSSDPRFWQDESGSSLEQDCSQPGNRMSAECRDERRSGQEPLFEVQPNSL